MNDHQRIDEEQAKPQEGTVATARDCDTACAKTQRPPPRLAAPRKPTETPGKPPAPEKCDTAQDPLQGSSTPPARPAVKTAVPNQEPLHACIDAGTTRHLEATEMERRAVRCRRTAREVVLRAACCCCCQLPERATIWLHVKWYEAEAQRRPNIRACTRRHQNMA